MYVSTHLYNMYEASPPSRPLRQRDFSLFTFHFSLFPKEKVTPILHSSFFILHFSFYILHLRRAPVSGALPPDILPVFCYFH